MAKSERKHIENVANIICIQHEAQHTLGFFNVYNHRWVFVSLSCHYLCAGAFALQSLYESRFLYVFFLHFIKFNKFIFIFVNSFEIKQQTFYLISSPGLLFIRALITQPMHSPVLSSFFFFKCYK